MPPPRKKDRLRGSLSPVWEQFTPTGTLYGGQAGLPGKSRPDEGAKTASGGGRGLCADCAHGRAADNGRCLVPGRRRTGCPPGQRACPGAKTVSGGGLGTAPMGERRAMGCLVPGRRHTGRTPGQRARPGAKTAPGGAGGCLDAGYGCYLPRAIRVIWMHRVGSTARPRIMPS